MLISPRRSGHVFKLFAISALAIWGQVALGDDDRTDKRVPPRNLRGPAEPPPPDLPTPSLRLRAESAHGVLVIYDAAAPDGDTDTHDCSGYLAYWQPSGVERVEVFSELLEDEHDLTGVVLSLGRDFGVDVDELGAGHQRLTKAMKARAARDPVESAWAPAMLERAVEIMGFDPLELRNDDETIDGGVATPPPFCDAAVRPPENCSPQVLFENAMYLITSCGGGGPGPGPGPTPCECCIGALESESEGSASLEGTVAACCVCDDGNFCTENRCTNGACWYDATTMEGVTCQDDNNPCTIHKCRSGACTVEPKVCNDNNLCTDDSCNPSTGCVYEPKDCDDGNDCTNDQCNPSNGNCQHNLVCGSAVCCDLPGRHIDCCWKELNDPCGVTCCDDGCCGGGRQCCGAECCTLGQVCCRGECCGGMCETCAELCLDPPACLQIECVVTDACDDGNVCTTDICDTLECGDWSCEHNPNTLLCPDDGDPCTRDVCDGIVGFCSHPPGHNGAACADDGNVCTSDLCSNGTCTHPPGNQSGDCPDDGNVCTDDYCLNGACIHPPHEGCLTCAGTSSAAVIAGQSGWCQEGTCVNESCGIFVGDGEACPGGTAEVIVSGDCSPECINWMDWTITSSSSHLTGSNGSLLCAGKSVTGQVAVSPQAPLGPLPIAIMGSTPGGGVCVEDGTVTVVLSATLSLNPSTIAATTAWPGMPANLSRSDITVTWSPAGCEGELRIVEIEPIEGYTPPNQGTLSRINAGLWRYLAFTEPQTELCARMAKVWVAAFHGETELARRSILVLPVHTFFTTGTNANLALDYDYLSWKYGSVLATTGGAFSSVTISENACVPCGLPSVCVPACTHIDDSVDFGTTAFSVSENAAASIIGHELVHTVGALNQSECTAYTWERGSETELCV